MSRYARIVVAGFLMHAILRGLGPTAIFLPEADYHVFLDTLAALGASGPVHAHTHVLMAAHVHLPMPPATDRGPTRRMKGLGQRDA